MYRVPERKLRLNLGCGTVPRCAARHRARLRQTAISSTAIVLQDNLDVIGATDAHHLRAQFGGAVEIAAIAEQMAAHAVEAPVLHDVFIMPAMFKDYVETL